MLFQRKFIFLSLVFAGACTGSSSDLDSELGTPLNPECDTGPRLVIDLTTDGSLGAIQIASNHEVVATCTLDCTVPLVPGQQYTLNVSSPSTAAISGVCSAADECSFTAGDGLQTAAATFHRDAISKEEWSVLLDEVVHTAAFDGVGNLITGGATTLFKLSPAGTTIWTRRLSAVAIATGPSDTIYAYVSADRTIRKLDADGFLLWSRTVPLGATGCSPHTFNHCIAVASDGAVVVRGESQLARWNTNGVPVWTISHAADSNLALAIDAAGIVHTTDESFDGEQRDLIRFAADGTALPPVEFFCNQYVAMLFPVSDTVGCTSSGHSAVYGDGIGSFDIPDSDYAPTGMAGNVAGDLGWAFYNGDERGTFQDWRMLRRGSSNWEIRGGTRELVEFFDVLGPLPHDIASAVDGRFALVGKYDGFQPDPERGWVRSFAP